MHVQWGRWTTKWLDLFELSVWVALLQRHAGQLLSDQITIYDAVAGLELDSLKTASYWASSIF